MTETDKILKRMDKVISQLDKFSVRQLQFIKRAIEELIWKKKTNVKRHWKNF